MITVKTSKQIPTSKMIRSFRSGGSVNHLSYAAADRGRIAAGYNQMLTHEEIRQWRKHQWQHQWQNHRLTSLPHEPNYSRLSPRLSPRLSSQPSTRPSSTKPS